MIDQAKPDALLECASWPRHLFADLVSNVRAYSRVNYHALKGMACDCAQNRVASGG